MKIAYRWRVAIEKGIVNGTYQFFATMVGLVSYAQLTNTQIALEDAVLPAVIISAMTAGLAFSKALKDEIDKELDYEINLRKLPRNKSSRLFRHLFL